MVGREKEAPGMYEVSRGVRMGLLDDGRMSVGWSNAAGNGFLICSSVVL